MNKEQIKIIESVREAFPDRKPYQWATSLVILEHSYRLDMAEVLATVLQNDPSLSLMGLVAHPLHAKVHALEEYLNSPSWYLLTACTDKDHNRVTKRDLCVQVFKALPVAYIEEEYRLFYDEPEDYDSEAEWKESLLVGYSNPYDNFLQPYYDLLLAPWHHVGAISIHVEQDGATEKLVESYLCEITDVDAYIIEPGTVNMSGYYAQKLPEEDYPQHDYHTGLGYHLSIYGEAMAREYLIQMLRRNGVCGDIQITDMGDLPDE